MYFISTQTYILNVTGMTLVLVDIAVEQQYQ